MARYLDPKNDLTFKRIFGENKHLCISLLNSLLPLEAPIESIEYNAGELIPEIPLLKNSIVDVRCVDTEGRHFIVEMQMQWSDAFKSRVLFNASKAYVRQLDASKQYNLLQPVYSLNLVNDTFDDSDEYYHHYKIVNIADTGKQIKGLEFIFVELPKFKARNIREMRLQVLWLRFLTEISDSDRVPEELLENSDIREAVKRLEENSYSKDELEVYDRARDSVITYISVLSVAELKGRTEGIAIGEAKGLTEGIAIGEANADARELKAKTEIAINLLKKGFSIEETAQLTGLSLSEVEELVQKIQQN